jgi:isoquinoline 1-oxidoreductase subunit beta
VDPAEADGPTRPLNRREFLGGAATLGGGLVLALSLPGWPKSPAGKNDGGQLNAWLQISSDDRITVVVDRSEMGQGVYTAMPMLLAEELEVDVATIKVIAAPVGDVYVNKLNGAQMTGTSNSVTDAWERLRTAGAQARYMLIAAAARKWGLPPSECRASNARILNTHGDSLSYGQLAEAAAKQPVPQKVVLKAANDFRVIGRGLARLDTPGKVDGSAIYGIDVKLPGMLHAVLAQSPVLGGKIRTLDAAIAEKMPGVRKVLTVSDGVVVVAEHYWQALQARGALKITWDPGANSTLDNAAIRKLLGDALTADSGLSARKDGDPMKALKNAKKTVTALYELPMLAHATMEPMNCTADVRSDGCELYVGTQVQKISQVAAAQACGLNPQQVRVHTTLLGCGLGRRLEVDFVPAAVAASKAAAAPVKLIWTREDDMTAGYYRPPAALRVSAGFDAAGKLSAWQLHIASPSITQRYTKLPGAPEVTDPFDSVTEAAVTFPYAVPNVGVSFTRKEIGITVAYVRSVSHAINCFAIESFMDELAGAAGADPYEFRRALLVQKPRHRRVLEAVADRAGWGRVPKGHFQGIALMEGYTTCVAQVAEISLQGGQIKVHRIVCALDCGQTVNPRILESQIQSGIVFGLSSALWGDVTITRGAVQQTNFNNYRVLRSNEMPQIDVHVIASDEPPGGIGEVAVPLVAPAVCNALFAATGQRLRSLPIAAHHSLRS